MVEISTLIGIYFSKSHYAKLKACGVYYHEAYGVCRYWFIDETDVEISEQNAIYMVHFSSVIFEHRFFFVLVFIRFFPAIIFVYISFSVF